MFFKKGDWVVHCTHGLGQILAIEERSFDTKNSHYYMVQVEDMTIWIPDDENLKSRLRRPSTEDEFRKWLKIFSEPAEKLPDDRRIRNTQLTETLKSGEAEALCKVIRNLTAYRHNHSWSEYDGALIKRVQKTLIGEWSFALSVTSHEAETELHKLLSIKEA